MGVCLSKPQPVHAPTAVEHPAAAQQTQIASTVAADIPVAEKPKEVVVDAPATVATMSKPTKIWVIYYSMYGHIAKLVDATAEALKEVEGVEVSVYQVAETLSEEILGKMHAPAKREHPVIDPHTLPEADGFVFAFPTRFGTMPAQFKAFLDATGSHWQKGALIGKPYALITSTATQNGGQESTLLTAIANFVHQGMIFVPAGYCYPGLFDMSTVHGGSPWGPSTHAGPDGSRTPSETELEFARIAAKKFAGVARKLAA